MRKPFSFILSILSFSTVFSSFLWAASEKNEPAVLRQGLILRATSFTDSKTWIPSIALLVKGDMPSNGQLIAQFEKPDGSLWGSVTLPVSKKTTDLSTVRPTVLDSSLSTTETGDFRFFIKLTDTKTNTEKTLYTGTFHVEKSPATNPRREDGYFIKQDWLLSVGQIYLTDADSDKPNLSATLFIDAPENRCAGVEASLVSLGTSLPKTIATAEVSAGTEISGTDKNSKYAYQECNLSFEQVKGFVKGDYQDRAKWHELSKNPGNYQIKIVRNDRPYSTFSFVVEPSGALKKMGIIEPGYQDYRMLIPITWTTLPSSLEGRSQNEADMFYGNGKRTSGSFVDLPISEMYKKFKRVLR